MNPQNLSRRRFIQISAAGAAALPAASSAGAEESVAKSPVASLPLGAPETVEKRNGMPYRAFGKTGEKVSILGVGGYHIGVPPSSEEAERIVRRAIDEGINFLDNAWEYHNGVSESRMGNALAGGYRDKAFLMTKVCARDRQGAMEQLEESLKRLKTDRIDLWQFHECNYDNDPDWILEGWRHPRRHPREGAGQGPLHRLHRAQVAPHPPQDAGPGLPLGCRPDAPQRHGRPLQELRARGAPGPQQAGDGGRRDEGPGRERRDTAHRKGHGRGVPPLRVEPEHPGLALSGMDSEKVLLENIGYARSFAPASADMIASVIDKVKEPAGDGRFERFKSTQDFDSTVHKKQHNLG